MNRKNSFLRILGIIFILSFLFLVLTEFMILIRNNYYRNADRKIVQLKNKKKQIEDIKNELSEYKNFNFEYNKFKEKNFLKYQNFSKFRKDLQELLSRYNFLSAGFNFNGKEIFKEFIKINLSIKLTGQYRELKRFIYDLMNSDKIIYINSIKLTKTNTNISGNFSVEVYFVK